MRRKDKAGTDSEGLLEKALVCRIGFAAGAKGGVAPDGDAEALPYADHPYVVPLHFVWDGRQLYFHCAQEGEKLRRLSRDNRVCVEIDELGGIATASRPCGFSTRFRSLIAFGRASLVEDDEEKRQALTALTAKYAGGKPPAMEFDAAEIERVAVVRVLLEHQTMKQATEDYSQDLSDA
jgi:nitroimidazol reductase NimA-like FMN-containing flavoprotein (pyridoxamine 5'-phosphate oxidase superfamily)